MTNNNTVVAARLLEPGQNMRPDLEGEIVTGGLKC
jgi:hypothetical protein